MSEVDELLVTPLATPNPATTDWVPLYNLGLGSSPSCRVYRTTNQSIPNVTGTAVAFDAERWDTDNIHDPVTTNSRLTCRTAGKYLIFGGVEISYAAGGSFRQVSITLNGTGNFIQVQRGNPGTAISELVVSTVYDLAVSDYVELVVGQDSGAALNVNASPSYSPEFGMIYLGPSGLTTPSLAGMPRITTSAISGGPPPSPADGDIWIATNVDANGTRWQFQYNAASASAYKWECIGGAATFSEVLTFEQTASLAYIDLATVGPSVAVARAGEYLISVFVDMVNNTVGKGAKAAAKIGAAATSDSDSAAVDAASGVNSGGSMSTTVRRAVVAGDLVKVQYRVDGGQGSFLYRRLLVQPVRVS